jgi:chloride channel protein, CIC family
LFNAISEHSIMTEKLGRRGLRVGRHYGVDPLATASVRRIMTSPVITLPASATVADARERFLRVGHGGYPVVDEDDHVLGIVTRGDVLGEDATPDQPVLDHASRDVVSVSPDDSVMAALNIMIDEQVEHVPVLDDGQLAGICTRTDLLKVREDQREHERRQQGFDFGAMRSLFARHNGSRTEAREH